MRAGKRHTVVVLAKKLGHAEKKGTKTRNLRGQLGKLVLCVGTIRWDGRNKKAFGPAGKPKKFENHIRMDCAAHLLSGSTYAV